MLFEVRVPWASLTEAERRFDETLRSFWGGAVETSPDDLFVAGVLRVRVRARRGDLS
jgi:hypothetical protein